MSNHETFEQLSALATTGDLDPEQFRQLQEHLLECSSCREAYDDFHAIVERAFPALDSPAQGRWRVLPAFGLKRRFAARARKEGIQLRESTGRPVILQPLTAGFRYYAVAGFAVLAAVAAVRFLPISMAPVEKDTQNITREISEQEVQPPEPSAPAPLTVVTTTTPERSAVEQELRAELSRLKTEFATLKENQAAEFARLQKDYDAAMEARAQLEDSRSVLLADIARLRQDSERDRGNRQLAEDRLSQAQGRLTSLAETISRNDDTINRQRRQIEDLTLTVSDQKRTIERDLDLLAKDRNIRDLMVARDLRIVDVRDEPASGKAPALSGRIFFTRGKSLIFYAYDLQEKSSSRNVVFQVWGKKDGRTQAARSLGFLYIDDATQSRWAMKFEDPKVLTEIDQVFVTVEPTGGSSQPQGRRLLSAAFLNDEPNHP
jgi:hypothetical protein